MASHCGDEDAVVGGGGHAESTKHDDDDCAVVGGGDHKKKKVSYEGTFSTNHGSTTHGKVTITGAQKRGRSEGQDTQGFATWSKGKSFWVGDGHGPKTGDAPPRCSAARAFHQVMLEGTFRTPEECRDQLMKAVNPIQYNGVCIAVLLHDQEANRWFLIFLGDCTFRVLRDGSVHYQAAHFADDDRDLPAEVLAKRRPPGIKHKPLPRIFNGKVERDDKGIMVQTRLAYGSTYRFDTGLGPAGSLGNREATIVHTPEIVELEICPGDVILMASDGFDESHHPTDQNIRALEIARAGSFDAKAARIGAYVEESVESWHTKWKVVKLDQEGRKIPFFADNHDHYMDGKNPLVHVMNDDLSVLVIEIPQAATDIGRMCSGGGC